jgi:hypothetical protein
MSEGRFQDAVAIMKQIKECEGERVVWKMKGLQVTYFIFSENRTQLLNAVNAFEHQDNTSQLWAVENRRVLRHFHKEIARLLHNFLASAATLIDHSRIFVNDVYEDGPFYQEYQANMEEVFARSELAAFIKGLRNWMVHKGLVPLVACLSGKDSNDLSVSSLVLSLETLRSWNKWSARAKGYLASLHSDPELRTIISSYGDLVETFYLWFEKRIQQIHEPAFKELERLQAQLRLVQAGGVGSQ